MTGHSPRPVRCAVYTRKSTEDGLLQEFNSLDAQYEACAAYALSQRHEGWTMVSERYDDGGFSGGNLERPALKRLLADVAAGSVDIILLYKIDRLTRSLADFAKIVEVLDKAGAKLYQDILSVKYYLHLLAILCYQYHHINLLLLSLNCFSFYTYKFILFKNYI